MIWSPRTSVVVAAFLGVVLLCSIIVASIKTSEPSAVIHPCALVLDARSGQQTCR